MPSAKFDILSKANQAAAVWLKDIGRELQGDRHASWRALSAVLHTLRDRLSEEQMAHLAGQMPLVVRGLFFEEWKPAKPQKIRKPADFINHVSARLKGVDSRKAVAAVFVTLQRHVGAFRKILKSLPPGIQALATMPEDEGASAYDWE